MTKCGRRNEKNQGSGHVGMDILYKTRISTSCLYSIGSFREHSIHQSCQVCTVGKNTSTTKEFTDGYPL